MKEIRKGNSSEAIYAAAHIDPELSRVFALQLQKQNKKKVRSTIW